MLSDKSNRETRDFTNPSSASLGSDFFAIAVGGTGIKNASSREVETVDFADMDYRFAASAHRPPGTRAFEFRDRWPFWVRVDLNLKAVSVELQRSTPKQSPRKRRRYAVAVAISTTQRRLSVKEI
jgi:hypothetical protein